MTMIYLANRLEEDQLKKLRATFMEMDTDKNGYICA
jgi:Ca2+-binding EF-hand superfamily protein